MRRNIRSISSRTMNALLDYVWPGNIRELQSLIERAVIRSTGDRLEVQVPAVERGAGTPKDLATGETLEEVERAHILAALKDTGWILAGPRAAAHRPGINRSTLQFRMKKLGIERPV